ncbi:actin-binding Rho-activating protein-like [Sitodiplosis mosellana]|uniref:actin-binding Rho-activating protein-like n=1 Tax=Sitodiplosis mosellana TaxID=263140 RepID=UPI0024446558|nr:actin-binding Rho-activating protein-like [Sitodiplosis mosellana]
MSHNQWFREQRGAVANVNAQSSPRPDPSREEYGRPVAGSLTEARGQKANIHIIREMLQLCEIIDTGGYVHCEETPELKVMFFGELFDIYASINNKLVGLLLRARKQGFIDFEGEMLFQRRDDEVPIFMLKTTDEIKAILNEKIEGIQQNASENPQPTDMLLK